MTFLPLHCRLTVRIQREARLLGFANPEREARMKQVKSQMEQDQEDRVEKAGGAASRLSLEDLKGRPLDASRQEAYLNAERQALLMGDTPDSRRYKGVLKKIEKLEEMYPTQDKKIQGMKFGFQGGKFTIREADKGFVKLALGHVAAEVKELSAPPSDATVTFPRHPRESTTDYNQRMDSLRKDDEQYARNYGEHNKAEIEEWQMVFDALKNCDNAFEASRAMVEQIRANPQLINRLTDTWKRENTPIYVELLRDAVIKDPTLLKGKEKELSSSDYERLVKEAAGINTGNGVLENANPLVLQYLPDAVKKKEEYRGWVVEAAKRDGNVLLFAAKEYDKFWKNKPEYADLCSNAVNQLPGLFFQHAEWLQPKRAQALRDVEASLTAETKVAIVGLMTVQNLSIFDNLEGRWAGFIERLLNTSAVETVKGDVPPPPTEEGGKRAKASEKPNDAALGTIRAISKNSALFEYVKKNDNPLYMKIFGELAKVEDPDMRETRTKFEGVMDDEDLVKAVLVKLQEFLMDGNVNAIRESKLDLSKIPEYVWKTGANKELFIKIFSAQGELFELAPLWMRSKKEYALPIIIKNASAYTHASENLRADPEVLYAALLAEKNGSGNMHWKHVPQALRDRLAKAGFDGMVDKDDPADTDKLLRVLILGLKEKEAVLTADKVHSFMDSWTPEMREDKELVTAYLERALPAHPEFYLDASEKLRNDFSFAKKMVGINHNVFSYITEDQQMEFSKKPGYREMVASVVSKNPALFEKVPEALRSQAEFITDIIQKTGKSELLKFAPESVRQNTDFLVSLLGGMMQDPKALSEFFKLLPEDAAIQVLLKNNGEILLKIFEVVDGAEKLVPRSVLRGDLLHRILLQYKDADNRSRMSDVLLRAIPTARLSTFTEHPDIALYLFEKSPVGIAAVLHESLITVDLLARLAEGYPDASSIQMLFTEMLGVKPLALVGLLRRRQELWGTIGSSLQDRLLPTIDRDTLKMLRGGNEQREKDRKAAETGKELDDLRTYRQEALYLLGLAPKTGEVSVRWNDGKSYTIDQIRTWLEKERVPAIMKNISEGTAKPEDLSKEVERYRTLVQALRGAVNPLDADPKALAGSFDEKTDATGIGVGEKTGEEVARTVALRQFIDVQKKRELPSNTSPADKKKAKEFLTSAEKEYTTALEQEVEKLSTLKLRGMNAEALRGYIRNVDKILTAAKEHGMSVRDPLKKEEWNRMIQDMEKLKDQAKLELRKVTESAGTRESEALYNLDASSLKFVDAATKELGVDRVKFAQALAKQGSRNARILSEEYLPMLRTPEQWEKIIQVAEAAGESQATFVAHIEAGNIDTFANDLLLSQEKHAAAIIATIRKDPMFPLGLKGELGTLDPKADRSMVVMASREMGSTFDASRLQGIWKTIRARQLERFGNSPDVVDGPMKSVKKIDVFVIAEDDGVEGASRQVIARSKDLAAALNRQHPGERGSVVSRPVGDKQQFANALQEFKALAESKDPTGKEKYGKDSDRHLVLRLVTHGRKSSGNALNIDPGAVASGLDPASTTLLYTSCYGGRHLTEMFGKTLKGSQVNVLSESAGTVTPIHTDDMIDQKISGAYEKDKDGKYVGDFNGDEVVSLPEAFHWLDRNSSFQDPQGFGPGGEAFTNTDKGKKAKGIV